MLFHRCSKLYGHTSVIITTNLDFAGTTSVLGAAKPTIALRARLTPHDHTVQWGHESHHFLYRSAVAKSRIMACAQTRRVDKQPHPETNI